MRESSLAFAKNLKRRKLCANLKRDKYLYIMLCAYAFIFSFIFVSADVGYHDCI